MPLEDYLDIQQTEEEILDRMLTSLPDDLDTTEGGHIHDWEIPTAIELVIANDRLRTIMEWGFAQTTFGEWLDRRAGEHGVERRLAVQAQGSVTFTGDNGTVIPIGSEVSAPTVEGVPAPIFTTDAEVTIAAGTAVVAVTAVEGGIDGNVGANTVTIFPLIPGLTGVTNPAAFVGGLDDETDPELLTRYLLRVRNPGSSGNQADYLNWALEVAGVGGAAVVPLEGGPGTVTVALIGTDKRAASAPVVAAVLAYIAPGGAATGTGKAPIGAAVTVQAATEITVTLGADLTIEAGYVEAAVRVEAEAAFDAYLQSLSFSTDNDVRHAKVITTLLDVPGVADATTVTINGGTVNIAIGVKEIAVKGAVTFT